MTTIIHPSFSYYGYWSRPKVNVTDPEFSRVIAFALKFCFKSLLSVGSGTGRGYM